MSLEKNIDRLPNTKKYLKEIIETVVEFQIRRCKNISSNKIYKNESIKRWKYKDCWN
ncbi:hypothetical protein LL037_01585 [Clostridium estertheticum]|uniref:hypothetical protein n=1 Tax=Clostridium estertheticum TaxID=238834 RepID=UPI001C0B42D9|nr:hypothetical protein [Clostridium estertheticum]MBU3198167.1 hypothetical protein [Clostridium estertheticum]WAG65957.1 hypothetical protein LL037_01585 [Clostridium estertheticum]